MLFRHDPTPVAASRAKERKAEKKRERTADTAPPSPTSPDLWEALRAMRLELAREQSVPPYVIFHDATLREIVAAMPSTLDELAEVHGVGASKLKNYGERVLKVVAAHRS